MSTTKDVKISPETWARTAAQEMAHPTPFPALNTTALISERGQTHGSFADNAYYGQQLRLLFRQSKGWTAATIYQQEALDHIAGKLSRILSGQPGFDDHWRDIAGYATLAVETMRESYDDRQLRSGHAYEVTTVEGRIGARKTCEPSRLDVQGVAMTDP